MAKGAFTRPGWPKATTALAVAVALADADGSFRFQGIPDGSYHLFASGPSNGRGGRGAILDVDPYFARSRVDVGGQDIEGITLAPEKGRSAAFVLSVLQSPGSEAACPPATQLVLSSLEDWGALLERRAPVNSSKAETITGLAPARYSVSVSVPGDACYLAADTVLDLSGSTDPGTVVVPVASAGSIRGRLNAGDQRPSDFAVVLMALDPADAARLVRIALPDHEYRFAFVGLRPGRYRIAARAAKDLPARWLTESGRMLELEVAGGASMDVELLAPAPSAGKP